MRLSDELKSEFAKLISKPEKQTETIMYGTIAIRDNIMYVNLDGSDVLTPITTTTSVKDGDRVTVLIKNHTAMVTGNLSSPSSSSSEVDEIRTAIENNDELDLRELEVRTMTIGETTDGNISAGNIKKISLR